MICTTQQLVLALLKACAMVLEKQFQCAFSLLQNSQLAIVALANR